MSEVEKKWLVKSNYKILGPFSYDQLEDILRKRQIALIDEVRDMDRRWSYIREIPELKTMAETIRAEIEQKTEATRTMQTAISVTTAQVNTKTSTKTEDIFFPDGTSSLPASFTDVEIEPQDVSFKETLSPSSKSSLSTSSNTKKQSSQFGAAKDPLVRKQIETSKNQSLKFFSIGLIILIMCGAGYFFYQKVTLESSEKALLMKLRKYTLLGLDQKALTIYQSLTTKQQQKVLSDITQLIPKLNSEGLIRSDSLIENLLNDSTVSSNQKAELEVILALQAMNIQDYNKAQAFLANAKNYDPMSDIVAENEGLLDFLMENYSEAEKKLTSVFKDNVKGRLLYGIAQARYYSDQTYTQVMESIDRYTATRVDYKKQLLLMQIIFATKMSNDSAIEYYFNDFVDTPIGLAQKFRIPSIVYKDLYSIDSAEQIFLKVKSQLPVKIQLLIGMHIKLEKADFVGAQKDYDLVAQTLTENERANAFLALESAQNHYQQMIAIEKSYPQVKWNTASHLALLRSKIQNSNMDVSTHFESLQNKKNILSAWAGFLMIAPTDNVKKKTYLQMNSPISDDFLPFLEAKSELE